jgi:hypothetical protein
VHIILFDYGSNIGRYFLNEMQSVKSSFGNIAEGNKMTFDMKEDVKPIFLLQLYRDNLIFGK